jgi:hypothetical protein
MSSYGIRYACPVLHKELLQMTNNQPLNNPAEELAEEECFELVGTDTPKPEPARKVREIVDRIKGRKTDKNTLNDFDWE